MRKRFWLCGLGASLVGAGCGATEPMTTAQLANSPSRIIQVFNDGQKIVVNGQTNGNSQLSLAIGKLRWTANGGRPDEFTASLEPSSEIPLGNGAKGDGFVFNVGDSRFNVCGNPVPPGQLVLRKNSQITQQGNQYTVADLVPTTGKPIPVVVQLLPKTMNTATSRRISSTNSR